MKKDDLGAVNFRSPKQELWTAYKQLRQLLEEKKDEKTLQPAGKKLDWRQQLLKGVKELEVQLQEREEELISFEEKIAKAKKELENLYQIKARAETLADLEEKIDSEENLWQRRKKQLEEEFSQEKAWKKTRLEKEEEEKRFLLEIKRRQLEQEMAQREKEWQKKQKHYQELQEEAARFPQVLEEEREKAAKGMKAELGKDFAQEKEILVQKHQAEERLLQQEVKNLLEKVRSEEQQIKLLASQLSEAHQRIKEMAVVALEAKGMGKLKEENSASH